MLRSAARFSSTAVRHHRRGLSTAAFGRIASSKVPSVEAGKEIDEIMKREMMPVLKAREGFAGAERVCPSPTPAR